MHWLIEHLWQQLRGAGVRTTRRVQVTYRASFYNPSPLSQAVTVVLPEPRSHFSQQTVESPLHYSEQPTQFGHSVNHQGHFAYWNKELKPHERWDVEQCYPVQVVPIDRRAYRLKEDIYPSNNDEEEILRLGAEAYQFLYVSEHLATNAIALEHLLKDVRRKTASASTTYEIIQAVNATVKTYLTYENPIPGLYSAKEALETRHVDCGGFDTLFVSLCIASGIPARVVCGFWTDAVDAMHAWAEARLPDGTWIPVDPSVEYLREQGRTRRLGEVGHTGSDRIIYSVGCDHIITINDKAYEIDILQTPLVFPTGTPVEMTYTFRTKIL